MVSENWKLSLAAGNLLDLYSDFRFFLAVWQKPQHPAGYLFKYLRADHYFCNRDRCPRADRLFRYSEFSWMRGTAYGTAGKACQPPSCRGCFCGKPALLSPAASCGKRNDRNRRIDLFLSHSFLLFIASAVHTWHPAGLPGQQLYIQ